MMSAYNFSRIPNPAPYTRTDHRLIHTNIPAPGTAEILARLDQVESRSMHGQLPIVWQHALDYQVTDIGGNRFIDFTSGIFVANVGHGNMAVLNSINDVGFLHSYAYATRIRAAYLTKLTKWSGFEKAFLLSSGTEATEAALKLMRLHGKKLGKRRGGILCIEGNYHGRTLGAQMMSSNGPQNEWIGFQDPCVIYMPFPHPQILKEMNDDGTRFFDHYITNIMSAMGITSDDDLCGVMLETFQGWAALFYPPAFVKAVEKFCREHNMLMCFDEMQAGFARTGRKFGYEHYDVKPDLICVGKGMGGGFPVSGVLGSAAVMDLPEVGDMSSTHSANPLACAAGIAVINEIDRLHLVSEADRKGFLLRDALEVLASKSNNINYIFGNGLIAALIVSDEEFASRVCERCYQKGLLVVCTGRESIKIGPPLTITDDALAEGVSVLAEAIEEIHKETTK